MRSAITAAIAAVADAATPWLPPRRRVNQWARNRGRDHVSATAADRWR
jgi:hypothetical protein